MSYTYNKMQKLKDLCKSIRATITKDIRSNGLSLEDFANEIGLSAGTLENKLKPASPYDFTITEFIHILDITGDYAPLEFLAKRYDFRLCKPDTTKSECDNLILAVTLKTFDLEELQGNLAKTIKEAIQDGEIDESEKEEIKNLAYELRKLAAELEESLR